MRFVPCGATSLLLLAASIALAGCGGAAGRLPNGSYERAELEFEDENYVDAIDDLKLFIRRSPTDERAPQAQLMIAKSYMAREDYPVAAVELEILRKDYPNSPLFDEAYYLQGMCYVEQVPRIELQQQVTEDAVVHFTNYLRDVPQGAHRDDVLRELAKLHRHLDEKLLATARQYARMDDWNATRVYLSSFIAERNDSQLLPEALFLLAQAEREIDWISEARGHLQELLDRFPEHPLASRARSELREVAEPNDQS